MARNELAAMNGSAAGIYAVVVLVLAALGAVVVVLITASTQSAILVALVGTLVVPTVGQLLNASQIKATGDETKAKVEEAHQSIVEKLGG